MSDSDGDLFDSSDDEAEKGKVVSAAAPPEAQATAAASVSSSADGTTDMLNVNDSDDETGGGLFRVGHEGSSSSGTSVQPRAREVAEEVPRSTALSLNRTKDTKLELVRPGKLVSFRMHRFDAETHDPQAERQILLEQEMDEHEVDLQLRNTIRWRKKGDGVESNARVVTWSDGSRSLLIGKNIMDFQETRHSKAHSVLSTNPGSSNVTLLVCQKDFDRTIYFRPTSVNSEMHRNMAKSLRRKRARERRKRVRDTTTSVDPEQAKRDREAELGEERRLKEKQRKAKGVGEVQKLRDLSENTNFLENMDGDDDDSSSGISEDDDSSGDSSDDATQQRRRVSKRARR